MIKLPRNLVGYALAICHFFTIYMLLAQEIPDSKIIVIQKGLKSNIEKTTKSFYNSDVIISHKAE